MTRIAGFFKKNYSGIDKILSNMLRALPTEEEQKRLRTRKKVITSFGGIGGKGTANLLHIADAEGTHLYVQGSVYGASLQDILTEYNRQGEKFLETLKIDGSFAGVLADENKKKLILFSDPFGLYPLYYYLTDDVLAFSANIKGLLEVPGFERQPDLETLASFWNFGFAFLDHTPFKNVSLLSAGTLLIFDLGDWKFEKKSYFNLLDLFGKYGSQQEFGDAAEAFHQAVLKRSSDIDSIKIGLSLSGGLDSRAILGGLGDKAQKISTYTLGLPGCADEHLASRMASIYKCSHTFIPIEEEKLKDFETLARMMVTLSDGMYHPHESTEGTALDYLSTRPFDLMLRGHGGEIAKVALAYPVQATAEMKTMKTSAVLESLFRKSSLAGGHIDMGSLLSDEVFRQVDGVAWDMFKKATEPAVNRKISNIDICVYLYIDEWIRRQVVASLSLFRSKVGVRLPYLDREFLATVLLLPAEKRWAGEFHRYFIHNFAPELESIPDSNTGAPLNAGPLRLFITDKVNAVLKRLGVTGFRHYTEFQKWQRKYFSSATEKILFSDQCLARGYYRREGLRKIFDHHVAGQGNYAHFLGTAVAIELWHRLFVD